MHFIQHTISLFFPVMRRKRLPHATTGLLWTMMLAFLFMNLGCKKFVQVDPPQTQLTSAAVFTDDASATSSLRGIYSEMMRTSGFASGGINSITCLTALSSDELFNYSLTPDMIQFYDNALSATNTLVKTSLWEEGYKYIYYANATLEGLSRSSSVSASLKNQLTGEAKFIRAFCHFYLVQLFGDIPLVLSTDYRVNQILPRTSVNLVMNQIVADLKKAEELLATDYSFSGGEKVCPNKWAATALLARCYLYREDWAAAESEATAVINQNTDFSLEHDLNRVFLKNSSEAIWQLMPVQPNKNTNEGNAFILTGQPSIYSLRPALLDSFESGDLRKSSWVNSVTIGSKTYYYPFKYKVKNAAALTEYSMVLRLAEQYLIRAEARARQGNILGAQQDLDAIRTRAGLGNTTATDQASLLRAIQHERLTELFTEWGHRWMDLKRTGEVSPVLQHVKTTSIQLQDLLYPIPKSEINNDPSLVQNPGY